MLRRLNASNSIGGRATCELENLARRLAALYPQDVITGSVIEGELAPPAVSGGSMPQSVDNLGGAVEMYLHLILPASRMACRRQVSTIAS
jgi:hypothetical protein